MSGGLREALGLPPVKQSPKSAQGGQFAASFRGGIAGLNGKMQLVASQAAQADLAPLDSQRIVLFEAYHKASAQIDPKNPKKAQPAIDRVMSAVTTMDVKASAVVSGVSAGREVWLSREAEFDDCLLQIGELEDAGHPKAAALRQAGDEIRKRVNGKKYQESAAALDQLKPKLQQIVADHQKQADGNVKAAGKAAAPGSLSFAALGPELLKWAPEILAALKGLGGGRRGAVIEVVNKSDRVIHRGEVTHKSGDFAKLPPDTIDPGKSAQFVVAGPKASVPVIDLPFGGAVGEMAWMLDLGTNWIIKWDNGVFEKTTADTHVEGTNASKYFGDKLHGGDTVAEFRYTLFGGEGPPGPGPTPGPTPAVGPDAASSCHVTITNDTKVTLTLAEQNHDRGDFMTFPAKTLAPGASTSFVSVETPNAKDAKDEGCKGFLLWQVGSPNVSWRVEWDNPEGSKNTASATFNPTSAGFTSLNQIGQGEENVPTSFTISGDGGGTTPPVGPGQREGLTVLVKDKQTGKPIQGAEVKVGDQTDVTGTIGVATVELPPGKHSYEAKAKGYKLATGNVNVIQGDNPELVIELEPEDDGPKQGLTVAVIDADTKTPISGAEVTVGRQSDVTSSNGLATFELPVGSHDYRASADGYQPKEDTVHVVQGDNAELVIELTKGDEKATRLSFVVINKETTEPIEGAAISVGGDQSATTDAKGEATFEVEAGGVPYMVEKEGFDSVDNVVEVVPGEPFTEIVELTKAEEVEFAPPPESKQPTLRKGDKSSDGWVEYLHKLLTKNGHSIPEKEFKEGLFGDGTYQAVKKFQGSTEPKCLVDGIVGNETWSMLRKGEREKVGVNEQPDEKGQEARWATEKTDFVTYQADADEIHMIAFSVGDTPLDPKTKVTVRVSGEDGSDKKAFIVELGDAVASGDGQEYVVKIPEVESRFGTGDLPVEAYFPKELGGDLWSGRVPVSGSGKGKKGTTPPETGTATLEVQVQDPEGAVSGGVTVRVTGGPSSPPDALTDSSGIARFELLPGEYFVNAAFRAHVWQPGHIKKDSLKPGETFVLRLKKMATGQLSVTVLLRDDSDVSPEVGATVTVAKAVHAPQKTDGNGQAHFALPPGTYTVSAVSADGKLSNSDSVTIGNDKPADLTLVLQPGNEKPQVEVGELEVLVGWAGSGPQPATMAGYHVIASTGAQGTTDDEGYVTLSGVPEGSATLSCQSADQKSGGSASVTVVAGQKTPVTIPVKENKDSPQQGTGKIDVTLRWAGEGYPPSDMSGYDVIASSGAQGVSDANGKVTLTDVPAGAITVACNNGSQGGHASVTVEADKTASVTIPVKDNKGGEEPPPEQGSVWYYITDAPSGFMIEGARVTVAGQPSNSAMGTLENVPPGDQPYAATADGYVSKSGTVKVVAGEMANLEVALEPVANIK